MKQKMVAYVRHIFFAICAIFLTVSFSHAYVSPGKASGYVNDFAGVFTAEQKSSLENVLSLFNASSTNEISIVTIKSLSDDYIENYAEKLFKEWGIGTKKYDNGVLLLIALDEREVRIEVGYGLEGTLTDVVASQIISDDMAPAFKQGDFYGGVTLATARIIEVTQGEYKNTGDKIGVQNFFSPQDLLIFVAILFQFFAAIFSRSKSWWAGGVVGALLGAGCTYFQLFGLTVLTGGLITILLTLIGLGFDYFVSKQYTEAISRGSSVPWWIGGNRGGRGGGSSFGGFGGGRSGGGGASGGW